MLFNEFHWIVACDDDKIVNLLKVFKLGDEMTRNLIKNNTEQNFFVVIHRISHTLEDFCTRGDMKSVEAEKMH